MTQHENIRNIYILKNLEILEMRKKYIYIFSFLIFNIFNLLKYTINNSDVLYNCTTSFIRKMWHSSQVFDTRINANTCKRISFEAVRSIRNVRYRPNIIEVFAVAIARRGFGFTSVSRGAKTARYSGRRHRGRGTPPRDENKICLAVARRENPLIARSQDFEPRSAMLRYKDTR